MKRNLILTLLFMALAVGGAMAQGRRALRINEIMVVNDSNIVDDYGRHSAWIELFNSAFAPLEISKVYLTNDPAHKQLYPVPVGDVNTKIPKRQHVVFWADNRPSDGTFHTNFELTPGVENYIAIIDADGKTVIDEVTVPADLAANTTYARSLDGAGVWERRDGKTATDYITPSSNNIIKEGNAKARMFAEQDENGFGLTIIAMAIVFSAAAAFLGLKVGQVFEAAIPIAIIAVGMGSVLDKKNMLGQNVIIQSIGACSGVIVAGAIFTLPALYILGLDAAFYQVFLSSLFGGLLGIVLLIPFRKYFVKEMHGKYPFPEATATTEVLISGEKGGNQAKLLAVAGLIGGLYDFAVGTFGMWTEAVSTRICEWGAVAADKFKVVFGLNTSAAVLGLGYIIGLKYAMIITAGSCLVWFVIVPVVGSLAEAVDPAAMLSLLGVTRADIVADPQSIFTAENLFAFIGKPIGIGGIAMAGIIGIIRQSKISRSRSSEAAKAPPQPPSARSATSR